MKQAHRCCELMYHRNGWSGVPCGRNAAYEFDGKHYCKTHHPPAVEARNSARNNRIRQELEDDEKQRELKRLIQSRDA